MLFRSGYGSDGASPEYPAHLGAWPMLFLGWAHADRPTEDTTVTIAPIENGGPVLELWFQGESDPEHFLIEERERLGFSRNLLAPGLIIYHVDDALIGQRLGGNRINVGTPPGLSLVEADGGDQLITGSNRGEPRDVFPGPLGRTALDDFTSPSLSSNGNAITNLELSNMARVAGGARVTARVRAFGWQRAQLLPAVSFTPSSASGPATRGVSLGDGRLAFVASETRGGGRAQVWLRLRSDATRWVPPVPVSQSAGNALEPTLALLPRGGFAVAWSDTRHGTSELYYRSFIDGLWSAERRLTDLPGSSRSPALSTDPFGGVHLAWLYTDAGIPQVMFMNFGYQSPGATPIAVTGPLDRPDSPAVAAGPDGGSYLIWPERSVSPTKLWFSRFSPDSGLRPRQRLTAPDNTLQQAVSAVVGIDGSLHALWLVTNVGENELRYQKREPAYAPPSVRDTVLERRGEPMQNLMITTDPNGGVHTVFEASSAGLPQVRYKHSTRARGWDLISTEVTSAQAGIASTPLVVATRDSRADVLYLGYPGGVPSWMMRRRDASAVGPPTAVAPGLSHPPTGLLAWPNPLHAGESLRLRYAGSSPIGEARVALFDLGGRRVAETRLVRDGESWVAAWPAEASRGWAAGVYFARVEGCAGVSRLVVLR